MERFSALCSRLLPEIYAPVLGATFDELDRYFFALRLGSAVTAGVWLWRLAAPGTSVEGLGLTAAFVAYSSLLYVEVWRHPGRRARAYLVAGPADLIFLFLLCLWSAEPMSGIYLAFYLLLALHAFYFGGLVAAAAAMSFTVLYTALYLWVPATQRCSLEE